MAPCGRFVRASGRHQRRDDAGQHGVRMLPADQIEALAGLTDEVERMTAVGEDPVGRGGVEQPREHSRRRTGRDRRQQRALRALAMAHGNPVSQPALERRRIRPARQRRAAAVRRFAVAVRCDSPAAVEQREVRFLGGEHRQQVAERGEDRRACSPVVAIADAE